MQDVRPTQWVIIASGAVMFLFSFLDLLEGEGVEGSAWSDFGLQTLPALIGLFAAGIVLLSAAGTLELPEQLLGLRINQYLLVLGVTAVLILLGFWNLAGNLENLGTEASPAAGLWLGLLGAIGLTVGAALDERNAPAGSSAGQATPF